MLFAAVGVLTTMFAAWSWKTDVGLSDAVLSGKEDGMRMEKMEDRDGGGKGRIRWTISQCYALDCDSHATSSRSFSHTLKQVPVAISFFVAIDFEH